MISKRQHFAYGEIFVSFEVALLKGKDSLESLGRRKRHSEPIQGQAARLFALVLQHSRGLPSKPLNALMTPLCLQALLMRVWRCRAASAKDGGQKQPPCRAAEKWQASGREIARPEIAR